MVEELWNKMCEETCIACNGTGIHYDKIACSLCEGHGFETPKKYLTQALTQAHQVGIDEAVEIVETLKKPALTKPVRKGVIGTMAINIEYNQALDDTIKALQDNK